MASGGIVDRIAAEYGIEFVNAARRVKGRHQAKCRRTCQTLLRRHGEGHLRQVLGLMNSARNRGSWTRQVVGAVSFVILSRPDLMGMPDTVEVLDAIDLKALRATAKAIDPGNATQALGHILSYELEKRLADQGIAA